MVTRSAHIKAKASTKWSHRTSPVLFQLHFRWVQPNFRFVSGFFVSFRSRLHPIAPEASRGVWSRKQQAEIPFRFAARRNRRPKSQGIIAPPDDALVFICQRVAGGDATSLARPEQQYLLYSIVAGYLLHYTSKVRLRLFRPPYSTYIACTI